MAVDPSLLAELRDMKDRLRRLETAIPLQNSSVTEGRLRFIGGLLRIDSGGSVEIVGTLQIDGATTATGSFTVSGPFELTGSFTATGPWELTGTGEISGDYQVTGKVTQVGDMDVDGVLTVNGDGWSITGNGEISGTLDLTGTVNLTGSLDVADGGYIQVGPTRISGSTEGLITSDLAVVFQTPQLRVDGSARIDQSLVVDGQVNLANLVPIAKSLTPDGSPVGSLYIDASGDVYRVVAG